MIFKKLFSFERYPEFVQLIWWRVFVPIFVKNSGIQFGRKVSFLGMPIVSMAPNSKILLGDRVSLCSSAKYTALGVNHPVVLRTLRPNACIKIGDDTGLSGASICAASEISIGKQCLFGANVVIADTDFHAIRPENRRYNNKLEDIAAAPINIGNNVFLGVGVVVLKGVTIGDNTVIGAGSVVSSDICANVVAVGCPAKIIKTI